MWLSVLNWFLAIFSVIVWVGAYVFYEKDKCFSWFDNKFGKDDPMPPTPKQQEGKLSIKEGSDITFNKKTTSDQKET